MALQTSGPISINDCSIEAGYGSGSNMSLNNSDLRDLADVLGSGSEISLNDFYGASNIIKGFRFCFFRICKWRHFKN